MRPPECAVCGKSFIPGKNGDGVQFQLSIKEKIEQKGMVEHPPGFEWFCSLHLPIAMKYKDLSWEVASKIIL